MIASAWVTPSDYSLSVEDVLVALSGGPGAGCPVKLLDPETLKVVRTTDSCDNAEAPGQVVVDFTPSGDEIRLAVTDPVTHRRRLGPLLMTLQNWDWDTGVPMRAVRIDPSTGVQSYVATLPVSLIGKGLDCHLTAGQSVFTHGALYFLAHPGGPGDNQYARVVRVEV